jgi:hypothetical protein
MADYQYVPRVTAEQLAVGTRLGLDLTQDTWAVAKARILDAVGTAIGDEERYDEPTQNQIAWAESLGIDVSPHSYRVAFAMIKDALSERENQLIRVMNLKPGDRVAREREVEYEGQIHKVRQEFVISSIRDDGLLYFKGGGGMSGWPSNFTKVEG